MSRFVHASKAPQGAQAPSAPTMAHGAIDTSRGTALLEKIALKLGNNGRMPRPKKK